MWFRKNKTGKTALTNEEIYELKEKSGETWGGFILDNYSAEYEFNAITWGNLFFLMRMVLTEAAKNNVEVKLLIKEMHARTKKSDD